MDITGGPYRTPGRKPDELVIENQGPDELWNFRSFGAGVHVFMFVAAALRLLWAGVAHQRVGGELVLAGLLVVTMPILHRRWTREQ